MPLKLGLNAILAIGIVIVFGLILAGYYCYDPILFKWYSWNFCSGDKSEIRSVAAAVAAKNKSAVPYIRKWLDSEDKRLILGACMVLENMEYDASAEFIPQMERLLSGPPSEITEAAIRVLEKYKFPFAEKGYLWIDKETMPVAWVRNYLIHVLETSGNEDERNAAFFNLTCIWDKYSVRPLERAMMREYFGSLRYCGMTQFSRRRDPSTLDFLVEYLEKKDPSDSHSKMEMEMAGNLIGKIGFPSGKEYLIERLITLLKAEPRTEIVEALLGAKGSERAAKVLMGLSEDSGVTQGIMFIQELADMKTKSVLPFLEKTMEENDGWGGYAAEKLLATGNSAIIDKVIKWNLYKNKKNLTDTWETANGSEDQDLFWVSPDFNEKSPFTEYLSGLYMRSSGPWDNAFINALTAKLGDENPDIRRIAMIYLSQIGDARVVAPLVKYYSEEKDLSLKRKCAKTVAMTYASDASAFFKSILETEDDYVLNMCAVWGLGEIRDKTAIPAIMKTREKFGRRGPVNSACIYALALMCDRNLMDFFIACLEDDNCPRDICIDALSLMATPLDNDAIDAIFPFVEKQFENASEFTDVGGYDGLRALSRIGGRYVSDKLFNLLIKTRNFLIADVLARLGDKRIFQIIEEEAVKNYSSYSWPSLLNYYKSLDIIGIIDDLENKNTYHRYRGEDYLLLKARENGGRDLIKARYAIELQNTMFEGAEHRYLYGVEAKWGNRYLLPGIYTGPFDYNKDLENETLAELPEDFPRYDKNAFMSKLKREKIRRKQRDWREKNKHNLRFDLANRKYYLTLSSENSTR